MKVLRISPTFYPHVTGPAYQAYRISAGIESRGHESPLITTSYVPEENPGYPPELDNGNFPFKIKRRNVWVSVDQYRFTPLVAIDALTSDYDVVHAHGYFNALKDVIYPISKIIRGKPFVLQVHGSFNDMLEDPTLNRTYQYKLYNSVCSRIAKHADAVVVNSQHEYQEAVEFGVPKKRIYEIPIGKDPEIYTSVPCSPPEEKFRILFVGRLAPRRNVEMLLNAVSKMDYNNVELRIVGGEGTLAGAHDGEYLDQLRSRAEFLDIEDITTFTGAKYGDELIKEFRSAHVFANPTHYENFGQANLEAAFASLPLVATPTGGAIDLIDSGETGYLVEDKNELCQKLEFLADNISTCEKLGEQARERAMKKYQWEHIIDQYESLYQKLHNN